MRTRAYLVLALLGSCIPHAASAQRRGTHLFAEVGGGYMTPVVGDLDGGLALHAAFGAGGKWRGFPPRFYLLGGMRWASFAGEVVQVPTGRFASAEVSDTQLFGGLRIVAPLGWILRLTFEGDLGTNLHDELVDRGPHDPVLRHSQWAPLFGLAAGIQARYHFRASVGLRASYSWASLGGSRLTRGAGFALDDDGARTAIELTHTWHF